MAIIRNDVVRLVGTGETDEVVVISIPRDRTNLYRVCNQFRCCTDRFNEQLEGCNVDPLPQSRPFYQHNLHLDQDFGAHNHFISTV